MTPTELADRMQAMDWQGVSLQHQLAVACAISTLRNEQAPSIVPTNVVPFPASAVVRTHRTVKLVTLDGHEWASAGFPRGEATATDAWSWVTETVAHEWSLREDQVGCTEGPDGEDWVTIDGLPAYALRICC